MQLGVLDDSRRIDSVHLDSPHHKLNRIDPNTEVAFRNGMGLCLVRSRRIGRAIRPGQDEDMKDKETRSSHLRPTLGRCATPPMDDLTTPRLALRT
jgi:hypothetical protein